jgi:hypothetical protein
MEKEELFKANAVGPEWRYMKTESICYGTLRKLMIVRYLTTVMCLIFLLSACATTSSTQRAQWKRDAAQPLTCSKGPDCEVKWDRALIWVRDINKSKIETANETIITTVFPLTSTSAVFSITKTQDDPGTFTINFRAACSAILGCVPTIEELKAGFANYVMKSIDPLPADGSQTAQAQKDKGFVRPKANLGAVTVKTNQAAADKLGMKEPKGARIIYIGSDGVAFDSGLHLDDVILKFSEQTINDADDLETILENTAPPRTVPITIWRAGIGEMIISVRF